MSFRTFWRPKSRAASSHQDSTQFERKLDAAEKKIDEYSRLIASLFAELRRYQDTICHTCKENVTRANLAADSPPIFTLPVSQPTASVPLQTVTASVQTETEPPFPTSSSYGAAHDLSSGSSPRVLVELLAHGNNTIGNSTPEVSTPQVTIKTAVPPHSADFDHPSRSTLGTTTEVAHTQPSPDPDWSVEYNPEIKKSLNIHVADTFTFPDRVSCTKYSRDGNYLAVGLRSGEAYIYGMMMGSKKICVLVERTPTVFYTDSVPRDSEIWTVQPGQQISEIDRRRLRAIFKHNQVVRCIDFSPNNRFLVSASYDGSVCLWGIRDGSKRTLYQHDFFRDFMSVAFSPNGRYVAAGDDDGFVRIWDVRTGWLLARRQIHASAFVWALMFTRNGEGIAVGADTVQFWDIHSLKGIESERDIITDPSKIPMNMNQIYEFNQRSCQAPALSFSSDNRWLLATFDSNVYILDAESGAWMCTLEGHTAQIWGAGFSPAGHYMVSGGTDGCVRLWRYDMVK